jgi:5-methylcytosine-specific restriction endonuclease McrA
MSKKDYRRRPEHQALYNSKEWQEIKRYTFQRTGGLCERCIEEGRAAGIPEGYITPGVDCHHIVPWETGRAMEEVKRLFFDRNNIRLLCIPCHIKTHQELRSHDAETIKERKAIKRERFMERNDPNYKPQKD